MVSVVAIVVADVVGSGFVVITDVVVAVVVEVVSNGVVLVLYVEVIYPLYRLLPLVCFPREP